MAKNISRLKETNFSEYNLREAYIGNQAEYIAALRDEAMFSNWGLPVLIKIPVDDLGNLNENNVDEYSNFVDITWLDTTEIVIPKFNDYRQNVSEEGMSADGVDAIYPLEVLIPSKLHLPRNSRIIFSEYNSKEEKIAREWVVLGTQMKQLSNSKTYTRIANCVPARQSLFTSTNTSNGDIWFDYYLSNVYKNLYLRAQGTFWFLRNRVYSNKIYKTYQDSIQEEFPDYPSYEEDVLVEMYYDNRNKNIVSSNAKFTIGDTFKLKDLYEQPIRILINKDTNIYSDLEIVITNVYENGDIKEFEFNINRGYTEFKENTYGYLFDNEHNELLCIKLISTTWQDDIYQETVDSSDKVNVKYIVPYRMDSRFISKSVTLSVLN